MAGDSGFNEVFFSNVRVPAAQVLGKVDQGWTTAITALMNERANLGTGMQVIFKRNLDALIARTHTVERNGGPALPEALLLPKTGDARFALVKLLLHTQPP